MKFFNNITLGEIKKIIPSSIYAIIEGLFKLIPAIVVTQIIQMIYNGYKIQGKVQFENIHIWAIILFFWIVFQIFLSSKLYDKSYLSAYEMSASGRMKLVEHIRKTSLGFLESKDPNDLTNMVLQDYALIETIISHLVPQLISSFGIPILVFATLFLINPILAISVFIVLPFSVIIIYLTSKIQVKISSNQIKAKIDSSGRMQEYLLGIKEIKSYNLTGDKFKRLNNSLKDLMNKSIKLEGIFGSIIMVSVVIMRSGFIIMLFVGSYLLMKGNLNFSIFVIFLLLGSRIYDPLTSIFMNFADIKYSNIASKRIMNIINEPILKGENNLNNDLKIKFNDVSFGYNNNVNVLKNINLEISPKTITAFIGPSGSGKSTMIKLLSRFYDVKNGEIEIGGCDIKNIDPENLLSHISFVFQDVYLFKDTIKNNILVGKKNASMDQVIAASKKAQCHDFIMSFPNGYDTLIGESGSTLSGGEKQRISIARAFLKDAPIILLDEATSSLDSENEYYIQKAINNLVEDKTVIIVAHKIKTIENANLIVVFNEGRIVEKGIHEELIRNKGLYHRLYMIQEKSDGWNISR